MSGTSHTLSADWTNLVNMLLYFTEQSSPVAPITKKIEHICHNTSDSLSLPHFLLIFTEFHHPYPKTSTNSYCLLSCPWHAFSFSPNLCFISPSRATPYPNNIHRFLLSCPSFSPNLCFILVEFLHHVPHLTPTKSTSQSYCHAPDMLSLSLLIFASSWWNFSMACRSLALSRRAAASRKTSLSAARCCCARCVFKNM